MHWVHQSHNWQGCAGCSTVSSVCPSCASIFHLLGLSTHVPTIYAPVPRPISQSLTSCTHWHSSTPVHRVLKYDLHLCRVVHEVRASLHTCTCSRTYQTLHSYAFIGNTIFLMVGQLHGRSPSRPPPPSWVILYPQSDSHHGHSHAALTPPLTTGMREDEWVWEWVCGELVLLCVL